MNDERADLSRGLSKTSPSPCPRFVPALSRHCQNKITVIYFRSRPAFPVG